MTRGCAWAVGALVALVSVGAAAQVQALDDGAWWLPGRFERGRQPDGNTLLLAGPDGIVVVDTGRHIEHARAIADWVRAQGRPLAAIVNTHWHLDHVGGNAPLQAQWPGLKRLGSAAIGAAVDDTMPRSRDQLQAMASDTATPPDLRRMVEIDLALYAQRAAFRPDVQVDEADRSLALAGRRVRIGLDQGPTRGDVWLLDEASGVLAAGDFVTLPVPFLDTACATRWSQALARLDALPFTTLLPGHGPPLDRGAFGRYRRAFDALQLCTADPDRPAAACAADWGRAVDAWLDDGGRRQVQPMLAHYIGQRLRAPAGQPLPGCAG